MSEALASAARALAGVSDTPRLDAELLLAHALGITREALLLGEHPIPASFAALIARRLAQEPIAYILGKRDFWTITLRVMPDVLIPRPDSETLIEAAVAHFGKRGPRTVLDLGTGSGALLLAALDQWPGATGLGVDLSEPALAVARGNAVALGLADRAAFEQRGWAGVGAFDLVLCNPPYVATGEALSPEVLREPHAALFAGTDGLDDYRTLAPVLARQIAPGGIACIEIGAGQRAAVTAIIENEILHVACRIDLAGRDRCLIVSVK